MPQHQYNFKALMNLKVLGAVLIFFSWIAQNYLESAWNQERIRNERLASVAATHGLSADYYFILLKTEKVKEKPNEEILLNAAGNFMRYAAYHIVISGSASRDYGQPETIPEIEARKIWQHAEEVQASKDVNTMLKLADEFSPLYSSVGTKLQRANDKRHAELLDTENRFNTWFLISYLLGGLILAVDFVRSKPK